jgi:hypothetical protein
MFENENDFLKDYVSDLGIVKTWLGAIALTTI